MRANTADCAIGAVGAEKWEKYRQFDAEQFLGTVLDPLRSRSKPPPIRFGCSFPIRCTTRQHQQEKVFAQSQRTPFDAESKDVIL